MGRFLRFLASRILLVAALGPLFAELRIDIDSSNSFISTPPPTAPTAFITSYFPLTFTLTSKSIISTVEALSATPSSSRRPPRIRPKRQSPTAPVPSDEASYGGGGSSDDDETIDKAGRDEDEAALDSFHQHEQALRDPSLLTGIRFADRTDLHPHTKEALANGFGRLQTMTYVQAATYGAAREGRSVLARSKTGSGKTLAFLIPALERLLDPDQQQELWRLGRSIGCVVLAPTRELAIQIADQAEVLVSYHNKHRNGRNQLRVACIYGGVKMQRDVRQLTGDYQGVGIGGLPTILVATPSRLLEHLEGNSPLNSSFRSSNGNSNIIQSRKGGKSKFASVFAETKIVVLDETDRLLQKSNRQETQKILGFMARADKRQTLLFSATFPRAVRRFLSNSTILSKNKKQIHGDDSHNRRNDNSDDFLEVDCIGKEVTKTGESSMSSSPYEPSVDLSSVSVNQKRIEESFVVLENMSQFIPSLLTIIRREQQRDGQNYKILVFFPAGRLVRFLFQFFTIGGLEAKENLWEIHSRMSQSSRTRASNSFREASKGILFSSDVSARGLDYPDISLVVQMGAPSSNQDYIHRIGRTGRAGKLGRSIMALLPFEGTTERKKKSSAGYHMDRNLEEDHQLASWLKEESQEEAEEDDSSSLYQLCTDDLEPIRSKVRSGHVVLTPGAEASYITFLAHYVATMSANPPKRKKTGSDKGGNRNNPNKNTIPPSEILAHAQDFVKGTGLANTPSLDDEFASKLGLPNTNTEIDTQ